MRIALAAAISMLASPVIAGPPQAPHWSADAHELRGRLSYDTVLTARPFTRGTWRIGLTCDVHDTRTGKKVSSEFYEGLARVRKPGVPGLISILFNDSATYGELTWLGNGDPILGTPFERCARGAANIGTGD